MYKQTFGVNIEVHEVQKSFYPELADHELQMFYLGWVADSPDPQDFVDILFYSGSTGNYTGYQNPTVNHLIEQARVATNAADRYALYQQAQQIIVTDAAAIPLYNDSEYRLIRPGVTGLGFTPLGTLDFSATQVQTPAKPLP